MTPEPTCEYRDEYRRLENLDETIGVLIQRIKHLERNLQIDTNDVVDTDHAKHLERLASGKNILVSSIWRSETCLRIAIDRVNKLICATSDSGHSTW